jgi:peptidoglycan/xylan/chitin deacetylase (PgdA/CDA1 family)
LTNEQIVAELAWTMKSIKDVTGVTPNTFRPPYGDLDDRVRAIAAAMGLRPIQWYHLFILVTVFFELTILLILGLTLGLPSSIPTVSWCPEPCLNDPNMRVDLDWKIPGGTATGLSSYAAFQNILSLQSNLSTGFIVLEHDLYQQTVDMAIGYFLPLAFNQSLKVCIRFT